MTTISSVCLVGVTARRSLMVNAVEAVRWRARCLDWVDTDISMAVADAADFGICRESRHVAFIPPA